MSTKVNSAEDFQDPLENYDTKKFEDPLECALAEENVAVMQHEPFVTVPSNTSIAEAVDKLAGLHVACLLVVDDGKLVGILSDRDVLNRVALEFESIKNRPVRDVMTNDPVYVYDTDSSAAVLCVMAVSGYRHVPVLDVQGRVVGIVSPQRVTKFLLSHVAE